MNVPTLHTPRLTLRPPVAEDWPEYVAFCASDRSVWMGGPFDTRAAWGLFCHDAALWSLYGHGALMVDLRTTGETVGSVGINAGPLFPERELGWFVYGGQEGCGYATEAAACMRDWAFGTLGLETLVSYVDPMNTRSARVAERLGARLDQTARGMDPEDQVWRHPPRVAGA